MTTPSDGPHSSRRDGGPESRVSERRVMAVVLAVVLAAAPVRAADSPMPAPDQDTTAEDVAPTYCGIYAVYGALRSLGLPVEFRSLVQPRYIGSPTGSSVVELEAAIADHGGFADRGSAMTVEDLEASEWPVILHTSTEHDPLAYNHWVLYLGVEDGMAKIVDASEAMSLMPFAQLLAQWDTIGIVVADQPIRGSLGRHRVIVAAWVAALALALLVLRGAVQITSFGKNRLLLPMAGIASCSMLLGVGYHSFSRDGLFASPDPVRMIRCARIPEPIPPVSAADLEPIIRSKLATVIDARFPTDYRLGHLPNAISIPVLSSRRKREYLMRGIAKDDPIVIYCQSESCPFDDILGGILVAEGYTNVRTYIGGWADWSKIHRP